MNAHRPASGRFASQCDFVRVASELLDVFVYLECSNRFRKEHLSAEFARRSVRPIYPFQGQPLIEKTEIAFDLFAIIKKAEYA